MLLPRPPEQRQPASLRDHSGVWPQPAQVHIHSDTAAVAGEVPRGEGQAAARETHSHTHALS